MAPPEITFYPDLIKGELVLELASDSSSSSASSPEESSGTPIGSSNDRDTSGGVGVVWNASTVVVESEANIEWTIFPSNGFLLPGQRCVRSVDERVITTARGSLIMYPYYILTPNVHASVLHGETTKGTLLSPHP